VTSITCYDGVGCIGGNKILLEDGGTRLWLDFGLDFGRMGRYYEEYLQPKGCLGLYEPIQMGLLPPILDIYRTDLVCSLADPWSGIEGRKLGDVAGVLLSHAHIDHIGALSYLRDDIPVYSSAVTLAMAKASQDTGIGGAGSHYCYITPYEPTETGVLKSVHQARGASKARPFVLVDETPSADLAEFWAGTPSSLSSRGRSHEAAPIATSSVCGGLNVRRWPVDHSVYGACAWAIETGSGWIVYTGDIRCHGGNAGLSRKFAEEAAKLKPRALIIEGTRIDSESTCTEQQVRDRAFDEIKNAKGLVVADFGPRNVERLASFLEIARETGRKLLLLPKDVYLLEKMALAAGDGLIPSPDDPAILVYSKYEATDRNWKRMLRGEYDSRMVTARQVAESQDKVIACFSFFDVNELAYIRPVPGSMWIYSSCEPFNEEMGIDFRRLKEWIDLFGMAFPAGSPDEKSRFHVSGHACRQHLLEVIDTIDPQVVIPVHTERPDKYAEALSGRRVIIPERGVPITL